MSSLKDVPVIYNASVIHQNIDTFLGVLSICYLERKVFVLGMQDLELTDPKPRMGNMMLVISGWTTF